MVAGVSRTKVAALTDRQDQLDVFCSAFAGAFGVRAIEVAKTQHEQASGAVQKRWQQIIDLLTAAPASPPA